MRENIPIYTSCTVKKAMGEECVESVELTGIDGSGKPIPGSEIVLDVDTICLAVGIRPRTRLLEMIDCGMKYLPELGGFCPIHDDNMETTVKNVFVAGDVSGCEEASTAMEEGKLAGLSVARSLGKIKEYHADKAKNEMLNNVSELRVGTFGEKRFEAKKELLKAMAL
jgi:thioredoxin reductase